MSLLLIDTAAACSGLAAAETIVFAERVGLAMFAAAAVMALIGVLQVWRTKTSPRVLAPRGRRHPGRFGSQRPGATP